MYGYWQSSVRRQIVCIIIQCVKNKVLRCCVILEEEEEQELEQETGFDQECCLFDVYLMRVLGGFKKIIILRAV